MRRPQLWILCVVVALCANAWADDRGEARTHYQAGVKLYASANYRDAIKEFSTAQQLAPADLNNYNLALCYDKLGEAEPAIQYYKEYLNKVPDAPKRSEIEASISRLDGALKSATTKKADEQKKADEAKRAADDAKKAEDAKKAPPPPIDSKVDEPKPVAGNGVGSTGTPSTGLTVSTGDAQLDRVQGINIDAIRDQRVGGASSGLPDNRGGPATNAPNGFGASAGAGAYGGPNPNGGPNAGAPNTAVGANGAAAGAPPPNGQQPDKPAPQETPVYKKWWFWAVVAVSAYVVYEIATQGSSSSTARETTFLPPMGNTGGAPATTGGFTLHF